MEIPAIHVDATVDSVGSTSLGAMDTPKDSASVAWYDLGPRPGQNGDAVIDGHSGWEKNIPAVFDHLDTLSIGDKIYVQDGNGATDTFIVRQVQIYKDNADASLIFHSTDGKAHLNLITCAGTWDAVTKNSSDRLVVFADLE